MYCNYSSLFLTHICLMDFPILINWVSPFPFLGVSGVLFQFYSILNRNSCKQTVKTLIRPRVLRRLIWVCTVCLGPKNGTAGLYGLILQLLVIYPPPTVNWGLEKKWVTYMEWPTWNLRLYLSRDMTKPTKWVCAQRRLWSAWASAQSYQSLRCALNG